MSEEVQTTEQPEVTPTTEQPVEAQEKSWVNEDGSFNRDAFGDLGGHTMFDKLKTVDEMAKAYMNLEQLKGKKVDELLASEDPDIRGKIMEMRGVPKDVGGYDFEYEAPESIGDISGKIESAKEKFLELGITKEAAEKLIKWDIERSSGEYDSFVQKQQEEFDGALSELKGEWKANTKNNIEKAANTLDYLGLSDLAEDVRDPKSVQALKFAKAINDKIIPLIENDEIVAARQSQTIATSKDRMDDIRGQMLKLHDEGQGRSPEYEKLTREMSELVSKIS